MALFGRAPKNRVDYAALRQSLFSGSDKHDNFVEETTQFTANPDKLLRKKDKKQLWYGSDGSITSNPDSKIVSRNPTDIIVPRGVPVTVKSDDFKITRTKSPDSTYNIGHHDGKELDKLILVINNSGLVSFTTELFNPSAPLDYLQSTGQNLNDKITIADSQNVQYTDMLSNILANPILIYNATVTASVLNPGADVSSQLAQLMQFTDKKLTGSTTVQPALLNLQLDVYQKQSDIVYYDFVKTFHSPYSPDGMDIINYNVLPGMQVTIAFFYQQTELNKFLHPELEKYKFKII